MAEMQEWTGGEVALLRRAKRALRDGDADASLQRLDRMAARYPGGVLKEEAVVARVIALCSADRTSDARRLAEAFIAKHPGSFHASRLRATCAFAPRDAK